MFGIQQFGVLFDPHQKRTGCLFIVRDRPVKNSLFDGVFDATHLAPWTDTKGTHYLLSVNWICPVSDPVFLLDSGDLLLEAVEIIAVSFHPPLIFTGDVGSAKGHQILQIVSRIKQKTTNGAVGHLIGDQRDGTKVQPNQLFHIAHAVVERKRKAAENFGNPFGAENLVPVKRPALPRVKSFGRGFGDVVKQCRPA